MPTQADQFAKAVHFGDLATLTRLVKKVDIEATDECGNTALTMAAASLENNQRGLDCLNLLIANGANVNAQCEIHCTALHNAALKNNASFVESLLNAGADPRLRNIHGLTALGLAQRGSCKECIKLLENPAQAAKKAPEENQEAKKPVTKKPAAATQSQSAAKKTIAKKPSASKKTS